MQIASACAVVSSIVSAPDNSACADAQRMSTSAIAAGRIRSIVARNDSAVDGNRLGRGAHPAEDVAGAEEEQHVRGEHVEAVDSDEENQGQEAQGTHRSRNVSRSRRGATKSDVNRQ